MKKTYNVKGCSQNHVSLVLKGLPCFVSTWNFLGSSFCCILGAIGKQFKTLWHEGPLLAASQTRKQELLSKRWGPTRLTDIKTYRLNQPWAPPVGWKAQLIPTIIFPPNQLWRNSFICHAPHYNKLSSKCNLAFVHFTALWIWRSA